MKIKKITIEQNEDVFDIEMKTNHNFFANEILVHNCEISLRPNQFCNLTEVNVSNVTSQEDLNNRVKAASFIGTLQASYTDFHYLRPVWQRNTEKDSLIGVGMTGIASGPVLELDLKEAAKIVKQENKRAADLLGIKSASRTTTVKPSGCLIPEQKIKTNLGELSLKEIFEINGYNLDEVKNLSREFLPCKEQIFVFNENNEKELITKLYVNGIETQKYFKIEMEDGEIFECTPNHKFLTENRGWVSADELTENDSILNY